MINSGRLALGPDRRGGSTSWQQGQYKFSWELWQSYLDSLRANFIRPSCVVHDQTRSPCPNGWAELFSPLWDSGSYSLDFVRVLNRSESLWPPVFQVEINVSDFVSVALGSAVCSFIQRVHSDVDVESRLIPFRELFLKVAGLERLCRENHGGEGKNLGSVSV